MQQLSLPLNLPGTEPDKIIWFQQMLQALDIHRSPAWCDSKALLPIADCFGLSLRKWLDTQGHSPIKTLSLFSGGGGLDIAFHDCGFEIVQMIELEAKYVQTLIHNSQPGKWLENSQPICIDIREYIPRDDLNIDFIIGGPPCQTFSAAGRRAAGVAGTSDARGTLFQEYVRLLKTLQPKGFLFENVYGITGAQKGEAWALIQNAFKEAGYTIHFRVLDAADYGVPQHRERLFIVGLKEGNYRFPYPTHGPDSLDKEPFSTAGEAVEGADISDADEGIGGRYGHLLTDIPPGLNYSFYTEEMGHPNPVFSWRSKFSDFLYKADPQMPVRTIKAQGGQYTGPFSWENRRFTITELKRLQTIPDDYDIVGNRQVCIEQIGNSVPPQLGRILALSILDQVMGVKLPFPMHYLPPEKKLGFRQRKRQLTEVYAQKAKAAIANLPKPEQVTSLLSSTYAIHDQTVRYLSTDFAWIEEKTSNSVKINLKYNLSNSEWLILAHKDEISKEEHQYVIEVSPALGCEDWILGTSKVRLCANDLDKHLFIALWKAFEEKLTELTGMADLVQLSGYYQYTPKIKGVLTFHSNLKGKEGSLAEAGGRREQFGGGFNPPPIANHQYHCILVGDERPLFPSVTSYTVPVGRFPPVSLTAEATPSAFCPLPPASEVEFFWHIVQCVVSGLGVATQLSAQELALLWGVDTDDVFPYLQSLRSLGYEVRNHNTNSQIPKGEYLIPYAFPTLTPKSVQLRKKLSKGDE